MRARPRTPVLASSRVTGRILAAAALVAAARVLTRLRRYRLAVTKIHPSLCDYLSAMCSKCRMLQKHGLEPFQQQRKAPSQACREPLNCLSKAANFEKKSLIPTGLGGLESLAAWGTETRV